MFRGMWQIICLRQSCCSHVYLQNYFPYYLFIFLSVAGLLPVGGPYSEYKIFNKSIEAIDQRVHNMKLKNLGHGGLLCQKINVCLWDILPSLNTDATSSNRRYVGIVNSMLFDLKFCAIDTFTRHSYIAQEQGLNFNSSFQGQLDDRFWPNYKRFFSQYLENHPLGKCQNELFIHTCAKLLVEKMSHLWSNTNGIQQFRFKSYDCRFSVVLYRNTKMRVRSPFRLVWGSVLGMIWIMSGWFQKISCQVGLHGIAK